MKDGASAAQSDTHRAVRARALGIRGVAPRRNASVKKKEPTMRRTALAAAALAAAFALPGCLIIDGSSSSGSSYRGHGSTTKIEFDQMVAANTQNRIGEPSEIVLGRFPAEHVSLVHSAATESGSDLAVYRVYAREKNRGTRFERYLVFEDNTLVLLTDDEDHIAYRYGHEIDLD